MPYRPYPPATPALVVRDPVVDLPADHLARLVDQVVDEIVDPPVRPPGRGQPQYNPRLCVKVLLYGYATGIRSTRRLEQLCEESLPFLLLTRGDAPCYHTLSTARNEQGEALEQVFVALLLLGSQLGMKRLGHLVVDSTKLRANASPEAVLKADEFEAVRAELKRVLEEAEIVDERESREGTRTRVRLGKPVPTEQVRDLVRRVRKATKRAAAAGEAAAGGEEAAEPLPEARAAAEKRGVRARERRESA